MVGADIGAVDTAGEEAVSATAIEARAAIKASAATVAAVQAARTAGSLVMGLGATAAGIVKSDPDGREPFQPSR